MLLGMHLLKWYQKYIYSPVSLRDKTIKMESSKSIKEKQQSTKLSKYFNISLCSKISATKLNFAVSDCLFCFYIHRNKSRITQREPGKYCLLSSPSSLFCEQYTRYLLLEAQCFNHFFSLNKNLFIFFTECFHHGVSYCRT